MDETEIKYFVESALLAAGRPLSVDQLQNLFDTAALPDKSEIRQAIGSLNEEYEQRGITIAEVASGFRMQVKAAMADRLQKLWEDRPPRYSRALFETLALIAYRQPTTRGEIEEIRGVSVSPNIVRSLLEREWVRVVGHRDVPGRPAMFGTTKLFLDYFGLKKLDDLPPLDDLSDWESLRVQLNLPAVEESEEQQPTARDLPEVPVLYPGDEAADGEGATGSAGPGGAETDPESGATTDDLAEAELLADQDIEEIIATEWPDPRQHLPVRDPIDLEDDEAAGNSAASDTTLTGG